VADWRKGASGRNRNWFRKRGNQVGGSHSQQVALRSGKQLARKRVSNTRTAKLLNKQPCRCHHAGAFVLRETATEAALCLQFPDRASSSSDPDGHIGDLAAQVGNVLADVRDRVGLANGKYCANYTPMLSEQSACRMISRSSFPDRELLVNFARYVLAERRAMCPAERRGGLSGAGGSSFPETEANRERGAVSATAPKLV
jgi:hypothetical protein